MNSGLSTTGLRSVTVYVITSGMPKRPGRPDFNQVVHGILERVTSGESCHDVEEAAAQPVAPAKAEREKDPAAVSLGRRGGLKGGKARMDSLTPKQRTALGKKAAAARWKKEKAKG